MLGAEDSVLSGVVSSLLMTVRLGGMAAVGCGGGSGGGSGDGCGIGDEVGTETCCRMTKESNYRSLTADIKPTLPSLAPSHSAFRHQKSGRLKLH